MQLAMSIGTLGLGLLLTLYLDVSPQLQPFGWLMVALGVVGIAAHYALRTRSGRGRTPR
jgi:hypothetical protein